MPACVLARLLCPGCFCPGYCTPCNLPAGLYAFQASLPRLVNTLPPACLSVCWTGYSAQATEHPPTYLPGVFACQATLPRLLHTLPTACLPLWWPGYSAKATEHPAACLHVCLLGRLLCPGYCTPCHLPVCLFGGQAILPRLLYPGYCTPCHLPAFLPVSCPGYSAQGTEHPASCLPVCLLDRLLCPGYCTPCHLPACLFAGQATLPRLQHTLPPAC